MTSDHPRTRQAKADRQHSDDALFVDPEELPTQIRIGDEPTAEKFDPATDPGAVLAASGLWTTTLKRHGPLWHLHLPRQTDCQPWWCVTPSDSARIARLDHPFDIDALGSDALGSDPHPHDPYTFPWGQLSKIIDAVWLTESGHNRVETAIDETWNQSWDESWNYPPLKRQQKEQYGAFGMWVPGCVLWLNWCFETVELYRHERPEALYTAPYTRPR